MLERCKTPTPAERTIRTELVINSALFLAGFGIFYLINKHFLPDGVTLSASQEMCALQTDADALAICRAGFDAGFAAVTEAVFPSYDALYPGCEPYYHNATDTGLCLDGEMPGAQAGVMNLMWQGLMNTAALKSAALSSFAMTGASFFWRQGGALVECVRERRNKNSAEGASTAVGSAAPVSKAIRPGGYAAI